MVEGKTMVLCGACCVAVLIPSIIMFACSFATLSQTQMGLDYSSISQTVDSTVYRSGLHFIGLGHSFIVYPTTLVSVDFSDDTVLKTRTSDGLPLTLGCSFQYRFQPGTVHKLYTTYGTNQDQIIRNTAQHLLNNLATNYSAYSFFNDKQGIATDMLTILEVYFNSRLYVSVEALQLTTTDLPTSFEDAIQETINVQQNISNVQKMQQNVRVKLQTEIIVAERNKQATISLAVGKASQIMQAARANANATSHTLDVQAASYSFIDEHLDMTNKTELLEYIYWDAIQDTPVTEFLVGLDPATYIQGSK